MMDSRQKRIYCISGLGADERAFVNLSVPGLVLIHLKQPPINKNEKMEDYALRVASAIDEKDAIVLGVSFGGMLAVEIAKQRTTKKIFLISSAKTKTELGYKNRFLKFMIDHELLPVRLLKIPNPVMFYIFGAKTKQEKKLLSSIVKVTNRRFLKRAIKMIANWENESKPDNIVHIHGTADKIIMPGNIKADFWIEGGEHLMVYSRAVEISEIITRNI